MALKKRKLARVGIEGSAFMTIQHTQCPGGGGAEETTLWFLTLMVYVT